jgi:hypothetical protein
MGVVFRAWDRQSKQHVAIKTLTRLTPAGVYRLKLEYRALANVVHPNLVQMHGLFEDQGRFCLVMELLEGETLAQLAESQPSIETLRDLFAQIACGLARIHAAGCVHRDLTPTNVMVTPEGRAVIMDFGLVSEQGLGVPGQTIVDGQISGTPGYLSPEQAAGRLVTPESDWYALGAMLRACLAAQVKSMRTQKGPVSAVSKRPSWLGRSGPRPDLERLSASLLERDPQRRATEAAVLAALGAGERVARPPPPPDRSSTPLSHELDQLRDAYLATDHDQPVVAFVRGASGSSRAELVSGFLEDLRRREEALVLSGRCDARETLPYRALDGIIDALSRHLRTMTRTEASYLLPRGIDALCVLFPALGRIEGLISERRRRQVHRDSVRTRSTAVRALKELLCRLADHRPLVLSIDDLEHGDRESFALLAELLSPPDPPALLLLGSIGSESFEGDEVAAFIAPLRAVPLLVLREVQLSTPRRRLAESSRRTR